MFDRDNHLRFDEAKHKAREQGVRLAVSVPCFEIWGIYHYQDYDAPVGRRECQKELEELDENYNKDRGKFFADKDVIKDKYRDAVNRAERSLTSRAEEGNPEGNPSTSVHLLTEEILRLVQLIRSQDN